MTDYVRNLSTNEACEGERGVMQAKAIVALAREDIRGYYFDLNPPLDHEDPVQVLRHTLNEMPSTVSEQRLLAVSLHRECFNRQHTSVPHRDYRRARLELMGSYILANDDAGVEQVIPTVAGNPAHGLVRTLYADSPYHEGLRAVFLPYAAHAEGALPVTRAIALRPTRMVGPVHVALRGIEHIVRQRDLPLPGHGR